MSNPVELAIRVSADVTDATAGMDAVKSSAAEMGDGVKRAATDVADASPRLDSIGDSADAAASKTGIMTGALGALAGGLEAVGLGPYAVALQGAAVATDVASGASDILALATQSTAVQTAISTARQVASKGAMVVSTAATYALATAQRVLNAVMRANPIGLIITALTIIIGLLVLAWNKSDTFQSIVKTLGEVAKDVFNKIKDFVGDLIGKFTDLVDKTDGIKETIKSGLELAFKPIEAAVGFVKDLIDWIGQIDFPDAPDWLKSVGSFVSPRVQSPTLVTPAPVTVNLTVNGALDADGTAQTIITILDQYLRRTTGQPLVIT